MLRQRILQDLKKAVEDLGYKDLDIVCSIPKNSDFGDYTTNVPLQLANQLSAVSHQSGEEIAIAIAKQISKKMGGLDYLEKVEPAGGFINFFLNKNALLESLHKVCDYSAFVNPEVELDLEKKKIFMEYSQPNTHKLFHIGHTRNISLGESISRLLESQGNEVYRSTYGSDIGLPVAKAIWGIKKLEKEYKKVQTADLEEKIKFLAKAYAMGAKAYDEDEKAREEIKALNLELYQKSPKITGLLEKTRQWSIEYFRKIYQRLQVKFDREFWESEVENEGKKLILENLGKVFVEDEGAVIFPGEKFGLHNRVFVSAAGNPTYEAKDLRLAQLKEEIWSFDLAIILSGSEQAEYFKVMFKALEAIDGKFAGKMMNFPFGMVNLASGKMSSRSGKIVTFDELYEMVREKVKKIASGEEEQSIDIVNIGAIKFAMLKFAPRTDIIFDLEKSVSLSGDSGPYIQYAYTRAKSVLRNAQYDYQVELPHSEKHPKKISHDLEKEEREILRKIEHFQDIVGEAAGNFSPNTLATYLLELASLFNLFYQKHPIIKSEEKSEVRLALTCCAAVILKQGLYLLGIEVPERM